MQRFVRPTLPRNVSGYFARKQATVDQGADVNASWDSARKTRTMGIAVGLLRSMVGETERCMYCSDSRGVSVDHFWPKAPYPDRAFHWLNMLLACDGCNRKKGDRFCLDATGSPLLIDPTSEDPWLYLFFDSDTGLLAARVDADTGLATPKGEHVTDPEVLPLNIEAVASGRRRTYRNLRRAVEAFMAAAASPRVREAAIIELQQAIEDNSNYGLATWCFVRDGSNEGVFLRFRNQFPDVRRTFLQTMRCFQA